MFAPDDSTAVYLLVGRNQFFFYPYIILATFVSIYIACMVVTARGTWVAIDHQTEIYYDGSGV